MKFKASFWQRKSTANFVKTVCLTVQSLIPKLIKAAVFMEKLLLMTFLVVVVIALVSFSHIVFEAYFTTELEYFLPLGFIALSVSSYVMYEVAKMIVPSQIGFKLPALRSILERAITYRPPSLSPARKK